MKSLKETKSHQIIEQKKGSGSGIQTTHFDTSSFRACDRFDACRARYETVYDVSLPDEATAFYARQTVWCLSSFLFAKSEIQRTNFVRGRHHLRRDPVDHWFFRRPIRGSFVTRIGDDVVKIAAGESGLFSMADCFDGRHEDSAGYGFYFPRDLFRPKSQILDDMRNTPLRGRLGNLFGDYLVLLEKRLPELTQDDTPAVVKATSAMLEACFAVSRDSLAAARLPIEQTLLERAREIVHAKLKSPQLGPKYLCRSLGISRSSLYRIFEPLGGVAHYVMRQRLKSVHSELSSTKHSRSIAKIAEEFGFMDAATFSRAFKREFGYRPSDARESTGLGNEHRFLNFYSSDGAVSSFRDWLRKL